MLIELSEDRALISLRNLMAEEKKRLEATISQLDEDLEEERTQNELMQEKVKRANLQVGILFIFYTILAIRLKTL